MAHAVCETLDQTQEGEGAACLSLGCCKACNESILVDMQSAGKLLPPQTHETVLEGELESKGRVIIIGDVHGCVKEMKELLVEAEYVHGVDTVILVGDLGDKGPYPLEVTPVYITYKRLKSISAECTRYRAACSLGASIGGTVQDSSLQSPDSTCNG